VIADTPIGPAIEAPAVDQPAVARRPRRRRRRRIGITLLGIFAFVVLVFPVYWMVATAFKPGQDIQSYSPKWFPFPPTTSNFSDAVHRPFFWNAVENSLIIVGAVVGISLVLAFLAALAIAKFSFYGRRPFIVLIIVIQMIPLTALIIPFAIWFGGVHLTNTLIGVIVTYMVFVLPFTVWTLRGFVHGVPRDLEEAAMVDGSTRFGAFVRILLPLVAPGLVATSIFAFIQAWNEFIIAYVFLTDPEKQTLGVWLAYFTTQRGTDWGPLMAGATLTALPVVFFFLLVHRRITFGLTAGAVRG
jgi:N,N'-diacetylchitobiose transport system permease protein